MKQSLTIITPCSRPENLKRIGKSIEPGRALFEITWRVVFDGSKVDAQDVPEAITGVCTRTESQFGNEQRNFALERTEGGWVYFLDDDNCVHADFFREMKAAIEQNPTAQAFAFHQALNHRLRIAIAENMRPRFVDMAQVCIERSLIGATRFLLEPYEADGIFIQAVYKSNPKAWVFLKMPLCYHNYLRS